MGTVKVITLLLVFVVGFILGLYIAAKKVTDDAINCFCEAQRLRDENKYLKDKLDCYPNTARVAYICDREACPECNNPDCHHIFDISHAQNFECVAENEYWEKEGNDGLSAQ